MKIDLLLTNGHLIDPAQGIDAPMEVAIADGKVIEVAPSIPAENAARVIDLAGRYVTPGLIDSHVHVYFSQGTPRAWGGDWSLQPDYFNLPHGVTTMVDAGSSGSATFEHFRATVIERAKTRIYALLNIADYGMTSLYNEQYPELNDEEAFVRIARENSDVIKGIKIAHYWGEDWGSVDCAKRFQRHVNLPIMVDFGKFLQSRPYDQLVMEKLDAGDITTHVFRAPVPIVDKNKRVYDFLFKAKERGIWFDLGHGASSFVLRSAVPAMRQGFLPDTFSSDLHALSINATVFGMDSLLSKMLACCDMPLMELFRRVTELPAKMLHIEDAGTLRPGMEADVAVWSLENGRFDFKDGDGGKVTGSKKLCCDMTLRAGEIVWDGKALASTPFELLPDDYGIQAGEVCVEPVF